MDPDGEEKWEYFMVILCNSYQEYGDISWEYLFNGMYHNMGMGQYL